MTDDNGAEADWKATEGLGPQAKLLLLDGAEELNVLVRGTGDFTPDELDALRDAGLAVRTVVGDILTGDVASDVLSAVLELGCVAEIEASTPLFYEEPFYDG